MSNKNDSKNTNKSAQLKQQNQTKKQQSQPSNDLSGAMQKAPYIAEEVLFTNKPAGVTLSGTLTLPQAGNPFPAVVLISGMGENDRDYTFCKHKMFLELADILTRNGIAVLRYDKRGVDKSGGVLDMSVTSKDLAGDALAAVEYLKNCSEINHKQIGVIGHSEGGMIAAMIAAQDKDIAFVVSMAGVAATDIHIVLEQTALQLQADGASEHMIAQDRIVREKVLNIVIHEPNNTTAKKLLQEVVAEYWTALSDKQKSEAETLAFAFTDKKAAGMIDMFNSPWYRFFLSYNPVDTLKQITVPVLAINGSCDWITLAKGLQVIAAALQQAGNTDYTTLELPNLNHRLVNCKTGSMQEYMVATEAIDQSVLQLISDWVVEKTISKQ
jgi:pimeloyl-ACP methyl ester carboxylesterase